MPDDGEITLPDPPDERAEQAASGESRSLIDDIEDLVLDAKTYFDAELTYQKTRASFVASQVKRIAAFGIAAALLAVLALIGLTVGLIIALTPLITGWGATAVVVGAMLFIIYLLVRRAGAAWSEIMNAIHEDKDS